MPYKDNMLSSHTGQLKSCLHVSKNNARGRYFVPSYCAGALKNVVIAALFSHRAV